MSCYTGPDTDDSTDLVMPEYLTCRAHRRGRHRRFTLPRDCDAAVVSRHWARAEYVADAARRAAQTAADDAHAKLGDTPWNAADLRRWAELDDAATAAASRYQWTCGRGWEVVRIMFARTPAVWSDGIASPDAAATLADLVHDAEPGVVPDDHRRRRHDTCADTPTGAPVAAVNLTPHAPPCPGMVSVRTHRRGEMT